MFPPQKKKLLKITLQQFALLYHEWNTDNRLNIQILLEIPVWNSFSNQFEISKLLIPAFLQVTGE